MERFLTCNMFNLKEGWISFFEKEFNLPYFLKLEDYLQDQYQNNTVFPQKKDIFKAFELTDYNDVKVVILGQDPYHNINEAHGLAFSTLQDKFPSSLKNIFKELENDCGYKRVNGNLTDWAKQGVLLLNTVLTVRENEANSHKNYGWEIFTNDIIKYLNERDEKIIFVLWGDYAIKKKELITNSCHSILTSAHPSPLAAYRGFFGSKPFSKVNQILVDNGKETIKW